MTTNRPMMPPARARRSDTHCAPASPSPAVVDPASLPEMYAMIGEGTCMAPAIPHGSRCVFTTAERPQQGDIVVLWFRPERAPSGQPQALVKRMIIAPPPWVKFPHQEHPDSDVAAVVMVEQDNPRRQFAVRCADLLAIHRFVGLADEVRPGRVRLREARR